MKSTCTRRGVLESIRTYWRSKWFKGTLSSTALSASPSSTTTTSSTKSDLPAEAFSLSSPSSPSSSSSSSSFFSVISPSPLDVVKRVVNERYTCRRFDPVKPVSLELVNELLTAAMRSPTAFNLQPWVAVVVHEASQREILSRAVLGQSQPSTAPVTIVFAGNMEPERNAPAVLEMSLDSGYTNPMYGPQYLRYVYYEMHAGPFSIMSHAKSFISSWYSQRTGNAMLSVPTTMQGYAWKQTMVPATTFMYLAEAAGLRTSMLEGFDEAQVRSVTGLPENFTVPVVVCVGYPETEAADRVRSPRFPPRHLIRWGRY